MDSLCFFQIEYNMGEVEPTICKSPNKIVPDFENKPQQIVLK